MVWLLLTLLLVMALWLSLRFMPARIERRVPFPYLIALIDFLWLPILLLALTAGLSSHWILLVCALVELLVAIIYHWPYFRGLFTMTDGSEALVGTALTFMTLNCRFGRVDVHDLLETIDLHDVSVLALQELDTTLVEKLKEAGLAQRLPYWQLGQRLTSDNGGFNGLWTRYPPVDSQSNLIDIPAAQTPSLSLSVKQILRLQDDGRSSATAEPCTGVFMTEHAGKPTYKSMPERLTVVSTHPKSPMRGSLDWSSGILSLGKLAANATSSNTVVVLGDLNSGLNHPNFRRLLSSGFQDASLAQARGPNPTFPSWLVWPRIELDHILFTEGLHVISSHSQAVQGSDHMALLAQLGIG